MAKSKVTFLLDENIGHLVEISLHRKGFDVVRTIPGTLDKQVLRRAREEKRILITLDRDIGYLVYHQRQEHSGVIYLRLQDESPQNIVRVLDKFKRHWPKLKGRFARVTEEKIVIRSLWSYSSRFHSSDHTTRMVRARFLSSMRTAKGGSLLRLSIATLSP